ncbi:phage antirepressor KilAC domain-containing protein [Paraburkholderia bonniea]|uniref:phage antirepressor KilAC domain-containing protein n=1 Tax=Paraburkholderia bonniea TaxID=2152891 RepID=UPI001290AAC5|nr:phage antirepressor KilAC domain-containing protein [Paraburkholderia bonniea]WJF91979.1 phage antirepressor KilAC domain-containing protein [Paraburkholderia bonniea]WJF95298.1 phage antirepressor KilAC domain-containing protein [Paraburkholderia bonniea]
MNLIPTLLTMSSREIAELVNSRHDNVKRAIERLAGRGVIVQPPVEDEPETDALGRLRLTQRYRIGKRDSFIVVAQLSPEFTARLVDRWQALEAQAAPSSVSLADPRALRTALLQYTERVIELEQAVAQQAPAVAFARAVSQTRDAISVGDMARVLGIGQNRFFQRLRDDRILMDGNRPYQTCIDRGYFRVIETVWFDAAGEPHPTFKTLITGTGQVWLQRRYSAKVAA